MHLNATPATQRINPAESRRLRATVQATHDPSRSICDTIHAAVVAARVAFNEDWSQEARVYRLEVEGTAQMTISR